MCFNDELVLPASLSSILPKEDDRYPSLSVNTLIIVETGPKYLFCSTSVPKEVDNLAF